MQNRPNIYLLSTASIFSAKYKGSDGIESNSTFNNKLVANILADYPPVDLPASIAAGVEKLDEQHYNSHRFDNYFRTDLRFGFRLNNSGRKISQTIYLDLQNVTARDNMFLQRYNHACTEFSFNSSKYSIRMIFNTNSNT